MDPHDFTIHTIFDRLRKIGDLFEKLSDEIIKEGNNRVLKKL